ncbi:hypothetical protein [Antrihabitans cavernicola]|nr:hypothetical protein [Spelaeibacter cavernicola]
MHRLKAALLRGRRTILVQYYEGSAEEAFLLSVELNIAHGLPLSLADRRTAAQRILSTHPEWSDRRIGQVVGLDHKTIGVIRGKSTGEIPQLDTRRGRDGRRRQVKKHDGDARKSASKGGNDENLSAHEPAPATKSDATSRRGVEGIAEPHRDSILTNLRNDPSVRFSESGRILIRWLEASPRTAEDFTKIAVQTPEHCIDSILSIANYNAEKWAILAAQLNRRKR